MQYKTIVLELLQQRPEMHAQLRKDRKLLPALEFYSSSKRRGRRARRATASTTFFKLLFRYSCE